MKLENDWGNGLPPGDISSMSDIVSDVQYLFFHSLNTNVVLSQSKFPLDGYEKKEELINMQASLCGAMSLFYAMSCLLRKDLFLELKQNAKSFSEETYSFINPRTGENKEYPNKENGWNHYALLEYAREKYIEGYTFQIEGENTKENLKKILDNDGMLLASIKSCGDKSFRDGHLVCILSITDSEYNYYDPDTGKVGKIGIDSFFSDMANGKYIALYSQEKYREFLRVEADEWEIQERKRLLGARPLRIDISGWENEERVKTLNCQSNIIFINSATQENEYVRFNIEIEGGLPVCIQLSLASIFAGELTDDLIKQMNPHIKNEEVDDLLPTIRTSARHLSGAILGPIKERRGSHS